MDRRLGRLSLYQLICANFNVILQKNHLSLRDSRVGAAGFLRFTLLSFRFQILSPNQIYSFKPNSPTSKKISVFFIRDSSSWFIRVSSKITLSVLWGSKWSVSPTWNSIFATWNMFLVRCSLLKMTKWLWSVVRAYGNRDGL